MSDNDITKIKGVGPKTADGLKKAGYKTVDQVAAATIDDLVKIDGVGRVTARKLIDNAKEIVETREEKEEKAPIPFEEEVYKPEPKKEPKPEPKPEPKKEPKPEPKPEPKKEPKPEPKKEPKPEPKPEPKKEPKPEPKKEPKPEPKKEPKPEPKKEPKPEPKPKKKKQKPPAPKPKPKEYDQDKLPIAIRKPFNRELAKRYKKPTIKPDRSQKTKKRHEIEINQTYGIVSDIVHDKLGRSGNRTLIISLRKKGYPTPSYIGKKVKIEMSGKEIRGKIVKVHGKEKSDTPSVLVRMNRPVSPHILQKKVEII